MYQYEKECLTPKQAEACKTKEFKHNEYICETAGFVPLEVKFKRLEQAGMRAQIQAKDFTSSDYRQMYLNPDFQIYESDEIEDMEENFRALQAHIQEVKKAAIAREYAKSVGSNAKAGTVEPEISNEKKSADAD